MTPAGLLLTIAPEPVERLDYYAPDRRQRDWRPVFPLATAVGVASAIAVKWTAIVLVAGWAPRAVWAIWIAVTVVSLPAAGFGTVWGFRLIDSEGCLHTAAGLVLFPANGLLLLFTVVEVAAVCSSPRPF